MKAGKNLWLLAVRAVAWKVLGLLAALTAADAVLLAWRQAGYWWRPWEVLDHWSFWVPWCLAALALSALLGTCLKGRKGGGCGLALRLGITRRQRLLWLLVLSAGCWLALWGWQTALGWAMGRYLAAQGEFGAQSVFFTFYQSNFLHSLMPLADGLRWIGTLGGFVGAILGCAAGTAGRWEGRGGLGGLLTPVWVLLVSMSTTSGFLAALGGLVSLGSGWMAFSLLWKEEET